jgi:2-dehydro-3-deoxyphosphooctonate aldolase (KDO 8-P synthase)
VAAGVDGIFLEVHPDPARARSDRESQWPLSDLKGLLQSWIKVRQSFADESLVGARPA